MPYTRIQEKLMDLMQEHSLSADTPGVEGLLIQLINSATDPAEAQRYLIGLKQHLKGDMSVSIVSGDVIFRAPYSG